MKQNKTLEEIKKEFEEIIGGDVVGEHWTKIWNFIESAISQTKQELIEEIWRGLSKKKSKLIEWDKEDKKNAILTNVLRLKDIGDILEKLSNK